MPGLQIGGSIYSGRDGSVGMDRNRWGAHIVYDKGRVGFKGEYAFGNTPDINRDANGWYALATYDITNKIEFVGRYEQIDPNNASDDEEMLTATTRSANITEATTKGKILTAGFNYYMMKQNAKIQLNWMRYEPNDGDTHNEYILNFQIKV